MTDLDLCYLPATDAIKRFKEKTLSPVELLDELIKRAGEVEPQINALTFRHFDEAREKAKTAEHKYATGKRTRPLEVSRLESKMRILLKASQHQAAH